MKTHVLCILDGWGLAEPGPHNSISLAATKVWPHLWHHYPRSILKASENAVGLPDGQMGNSEVGHMTMGSGRQIYQDLPRIQKAIETKEIFQHPSLRALLDVKGTIHIMGLLSHGGVHAHQDHGLALARFLQSHGKKIWFHGFLDGRDCPPKSAHTFLDTCGDIPMATLGGRYFAMDRDQRWERIQKAYDASINGQSQDTYGCPHAYVQRCYDQGLTDEFIPPACHQDYQGASPEDHLVLFNFRADRMRQWTAALVDPDFTFFERPHTYAHQTLGMTDYGAGLSSYYDVLFPPQSPDHTLGQVVSQAQLTQLRLAETEKYAHVTFFFNGGKEEPLPGESRYLVPSPKVGTYDECPEMAAEVLTQKAVETIEEGKTSLIIMNFANADMVGHTGNLEATKKAVAVLDACLGRLYQTIKKCKGTLVITADHGNAEMMADENGQPHTAHTLNPVPLVVVDPDFYSDQPCALPEGDLADIAPTLLDLMGLAIPKDMSGKSLWRRTILNVS